MTHFSATCETNVFEGVDISEEAFADKENTIIANSDFINGMNYQQATAKVIEELEKRLKEKENPPFGLSTNSAGRYCLSNKRNSNLF